MRLAKSEDLQDRDDFVVVVVAASSDEIHSSILKAALRRSINFNLQTVGAFTSESYALATYFYAEIELLDETRSLSTRRR